MQNLLINQLSSHLPSVKFKAGDDFIWSPKNNTVFYKSDIVDKPQGQWALIHETCHAKLKHFSYGLDIELLKLEAEAWNEAKKIAKKFEINIDENHIQNCLDTYRDWLYRRSKCPVCTLVSVQTSDKEYRCHNCHTSWSVTAARFCRPYRLKVKV